MKRSFIKIISLILSLTLILSASVFTATVGAEPTVSASSKKESVKTRDGLLVPLDNDYRSRTEVTYTNINGEDVTVYGLYRAKEESGNNPNFSQAVMVYQCIKYKQAHPDEAVYLSMQSFHFSIALAACVDPENENYGHTKNLYGKEYDEDYIRLSYLLVEAAKMGIEVIMISQLDASAVTDENGNLVPDYSFAQYFESHMNDDAYVAGKKVSDFMRFGNCKWTSYGDKSAADMMHNKICTVSAYIDNDGVEHGPAIWTGSINVDGVNYLEQNGNDSINTAIVITGHEKMRKIMYNFATLMLDYCDQEDIVPFRVEVVKRTNEQMELLLRGAAVEEDEQILYLGTENDPVFELYFTPLGGDFSTFDTVYNPYAKYLARMYSASFGADHIEFIWNNVKYNQTFELADTIADVIAQSFRNNANKNSLLHLHLHGIKADPFWGITEGVNVGYFYLNREYLYHHIKDVQLSYVEGGQRQYISIINSLNFHEGSMYHQTNTIVVIKENDTIGSNFYSEYAGITTPSLDILSRRVVAK